MVSLMPFWRRRQRPVPQAPAAPRADDLARLGLTIEGERPAWIAEQQSSRADVRRPEDPVVRPDVAAARAAQQAAKERLGAPVWSV